MLVRTKHLADAMRHRIMHILLLLLVPVLCTEYYSFIAYVHSPGSHAKSPEMTSRRFDPVTFQRSMRPLQQQLQQHTLRCLARRTPRRNIPTLASLTPHAPPRAPPIISQQLSIRCHPYTAATPQAMSDPTATTTTAEDDAYADFLLKQSTADYSTPKTSKAASASASAHRAPPPRESLPASVTALVDSGRVYTSDVDEGFEAVSLPVPSVAAGTAQSGVHSTQVSSHELARALGVAEGTVSKLSVQEWDPRQEYRDVVGAVSDWLRQGGTATGDGAVAIFAVQGQGARVEYFVVGLLRGGEPDGHRIVGTRVLAVES